MQGLRFTRKKSDGLGLSIQLVNEMPAHLDTSIEKIWGWESICDGFMQI